MRGNYTGTVCHSVAYRGAGEQKEKSPACSRAGRGVTYYSFMPDSVKLYVF